MNKYLVTGRIMRLEKCGCEYCDGHERLTEKVQDRVVVALDEEDAAQRVLDEVSEEQGKRRGYRGLKWHEYDKPTVVLAPDEHEDVILHSTPVNLLERAKGVGLRNFWQ